MRVTNRLFARTGVIAFAAFLLVGGAAAFADTSSVGIDPTGDLSPARTSATLTGTVACDAGQTATLTVHIYESVGRLINIGIGSVSAFTCSGSSDTWSADVAAIPGLKFQPGPATVVVRSVTTVTVTDPITQVTTTTITGDREFGGKVNLHP